MNNSFLGSVLTCCVMQLILSIFTSHPARAQTADSKKPALIGVASFKGPLKVEIDTNLWYKIKAGKIRDPDPGDFAYLGNIISKRVMEDLKTKYPDRVIHISAAAIDDDESDDVPLKKKESAKYILKGTIDSVRFEANVVLGPWYSLNISARLISTESGDVVWSMHNHQFQKIYKTVPGEEEADVFAQIIVPKVVTYVSPRVQQALDSTN